MTHYKRVVAAYHNVFNWKLALVSALVNGAIVAWVNRHHGLHEYLFAGGWQAALSAVSTGVTARVAQHLSLIRRPLPAYTLGSGVPALMTLAFTWVVHSLNGTPELLMSCAWPTFFSCTTSMIMNTLMRNEPLLPDWWWVRLGMRIIVPKNYKGSID